jgi:hypothetical protein
MRIYIFKKRTWKQSSYIKESIDDMIFFSFAQIILREYLCDHVFLIEDFSLKEKCIYTDSQIHDIEK